MALDPSTFQYLTPTADQIQQMNTVRFCFSELAKMVEAHVPEGTDRDHAIRLLRSAAMWCNVAITRDDYGSPRQAASAAPRAWPDLSPEERAEQLRTNPPVEIPGDPTPRKSAS
ncbi:MAG TPA: hypothetical protein VHK68_04045 [Gemmatimonadales bacterium]|nr:hypothetical protein [Gemmatimonadales bacterium]